MKYFATYFKGFKKHNDITSLVILFEQSIIINVLRYKQQIQWNEENFSSQLGY
jgi:hypothetical protein